MSLAEKIWCELDDVGYIDHVHPHRSSADRPASPVVPYVQRLESATSLDPAADSLSAVIKPMVSGPRLRGALCGEWLGHAVHPLLTDLPLGAWTCTSLLDLFGDERSRPAATGLLAFGMATAVPTVATGAAEWVGTTGGTRRVGTVHAIVNTTAAGLYGASLYVRLRDRHRLGVALGVMGGLMATVGGYLGGHLTIARKVGTADPAFHDGSPI